MVKRAEKGENEIRDRNIRDMYFNFSKKRDGNYLEHSNDFSERISLGEENIHRRHELEDKYKRLAKELYKYSQDTLKPNPKTIDIIIAAFIIQAIVVGAYLSPAIGYIMGGGLSLYYLVEYLLNRKKGKETRLNNIYVIIYLFLCIYFKNLSIIISGILYYIFTISWGIYALQGGDYPVRIVSSMVLNGIFYFAIKNYHIWFFSIRGNILKIVLMQVSVAMVSISNLESISYILNLYRKRAEEDFKSTVSGLIYIDPNNRLLKCKPYEAFGLDISQSGENLLDRFKILSPRTWIYTILGNSLILGVLMFLKFTDKDLSIQEIKECIVRIWRILEEHVSKCSF